MAMMRALTSTKRKPAEIKTRLQAEYLSKKVPVYSYHLTGKRTMKR
jgi:hypothetical protein